MPSVAIIGSGISGLSAAYLLRKAYDVTILEKAHYFGGHSNTIDVQSERKMIPVDTGFIVFNHQTYPNLLGLFRALNVATHKSNMSFGVTLPRENLEYSGSSFRQFFAQKKNLVSPKFIKMGLDILKFNKVANMIDESALAHQSLEEFVNELGLGKGFRQWYLYPMAAAIWSTPLGQIKHYPAQSFIRFFRNHGLLQVTDHPQWYTVTGGSREYVAKIMNLPDIKGRLHQSITTIKRSNKGCEIVFSDGHSDHFDHVVFATPAPIALSLLDNPTAQEQAVLQNFKYSDNKAYLHRDESVMPKSKKAWASWIYSDRATKTRQNNVAVSYWMNQLQSLDTSEQIFVTLNPEIPIDETKIERIITYQHPIFDHNAIAAQKDIDLLQGDQNTWFCGAYHRYGFHEDGIWSAVQMAKKMGVDTAWG